MREGQAFTLLKRAPTPQLCNTCSRSSIPIFLIDWWCYRERILHRGVNKNLWFGAYCRTSVFLSRNFPYMLIRPSFSDDAFLSSDL